MTLKGHYMGLNLGVFWQMGGYTGTDFWAGESDAFTGVFCRIFWGIIGTGYVPRIRSKTILPALTKMVP